MKGSVAALNRGAFAYLQPMRTRLREQPPIPRNNEKASLIKGMVGKGMCLSRSQSLKAVLFMHFFLKKKEVVVNIWQL